MRNIVDVIKQVEDALPRNDLLRLSLASLYQSVTYTAPEAMRERWVEFQFYLVERFKFELESELAVKVRKIFNDE